VLPAAQTTRLLTVGSGAAHRQRVLAWAGAMPDRVQTRASILHLAPVAQETPSRWDERPQLVGLTPQGLARQWRGPDRDFVLEAPGPEAEGLAGRCDALVLSEAERDSCQGLIDSATAVGASVAVTAGDRHTTVLSSGTSVSLAAPTVERALDDVGAGDVFAAAFFVALAEGRPPPDAGAFANAAAAVRIRGRGPDAVARRAQIDAQLAR
jgi:sugar/nucleoside kinase (ribokinase family)